MPRKGPECQFEEQQVRRQAELQVEHEGPAEAARDLRGGVVGHRLGGVGIRSSEKRFSFGAIFRIFSINQY